MTESVMDLMRLILHLSGTDCVSIVETESGICSATVGTPELAERRYSSSYAADGLLVSNAVYSCLGRSDYHEILVGADLALAWSIPLVEFMLVGYSQLLAASESPSEPFHSAVRLLKRELSTNPPTVASGSTIRPVERTSASPQVLERVACDHPIADAISQMIWTADNTGKVDYFNRAWTAYVGKDADESAGGNWTDFIHPDDYEGVLAHWNRVLQIGVPFERECQLRRADAVYRWHVVQAMPLWSDDAIIKWIGTALDIEDTRSAENAFRQSEARLRSVVTGAPIILFAMDSKGTFTLSDGSVLASIGQKPGEAVGKTVFDLYRDYPLLLHGATRALRGEAHTAVNNVFDRWFETMYMPQFDENHTLVSVVGVSLDVTKRHEAEEAIRIAHEQLEARVQDRTAQLAAANKELQDQYSKRKRDRDDLNLFADIVKNMQIGIYVYQLTDDRGSRKLKMIATNPAATTFTGNTQEEVLGRFLEDSSSTQYDASFSEQYYEVMRSGVPQFSEHILPTLDGGVKNAYSARVFPLPNASVGVAFENITERKQAEIELQRVLLQTEQMLGAISSILIGLDSNGFVTTWNGTARSTFGQSATDVFGLQFSECDIKWDWEQILPAMEECAAGTIPIHIEDLVYTKSDGKDGYLDISINPIKSLSGDHQGMLVLASDVSERRLLQSQLSQAQKLESIGQLAAGIAHEINTPIQYVGDNTRFFKDAFTCVKDVLSHTQGLIRAAEKAGLNDPVVQKTSHAYAAADIEYLLDEVPNAIQQSLDGVERVACIVRAMKEFSHPGSTDKAAVDLNKALESTITVAKSEWKYVATMETDFDRDIPMLSCFAADLNQVFLNIIVNAAHAIGDVVGDGAQGLGQITVKTRSIKDHVEVRISDTGTGMSEEIQKRIFDPFFTTKGVGKGTGQGLAISHSVVVDKHGGQLLVETEIGKGSVFIIRLPVAAKI